MKRLRSKLTYSNVVASLALFFVLAGGTAYAAGEILPKNSVGSAQIKKAAVTPSKLSKAAKKSLTGREGTTGPQGPRGEKGERGDVGPAGPLAEVLPSGKTERGMYLFDGNEPSTATYIPNTSISFPVPLNFTPTLTFIKVGGSPTGACSGTTSAPTAAPGHLCIYESRDDNGYTTGADIESSTARLGALLYVEATPGSGFEIEGSYAVTAP